MSDLYNIDIQQLSNNSLYFIKSAFNRDDTEKIINYFNSNADLVGLKVRFIWLPEGIELKQVIIKGDYVK